MTEYDVSERDDEVLDYEDEFDVSDSDDDLEFDENATDDDDLFADDDDDDDPFADDEDEKAIPALHLAKEVGLRVHEALQPFVKARVPEFGNTSISVSSPVSVYTQRARTVLAAVILSLRLETVVGRLR